MTGLSVISVVKNLVAEDREQAFLYGMGALRAQTPLDFEQVFVDGASTDATLDLIDAHLAALPEGTPTRVLSEPDRGVYDAMNKGAALASGKYLFFYNSDDYLLAPDLLRRAVAEIERTGADYLYGQKEVERPDGRIKLWWRMSPDNVLHMVPFGHGSLITTRAAFAKLGGFSTRWRVYGDYDFMFRLIAGGYRGVHFPYPMVRFAAGGISSVQEGLRAEFADVWSRRVGDYVSLSGVPLEEIQTWIRCKIFPAEVLDILERDPGVPEGLRRAARVCRKISRRHRLKQALGV